VLKLVSDAGIGRGSTVLELACGKGTLALSIAESRGCNVTACDAFPPFLDEARDCANRRGLSARCRFLPMDLSATGPLPFENFDAAIMIGLWPFDRAIRALRKTVSPGGIYIVDDALLIDAADDDADRAESASAESVRRFVRRQGDELLSLRPVPASEARTLQTDLLKQLRLNARQLGRRHPSINATLTAFIQRQHLAFGRLQGPLRPHVLCCRRRS